MDMRTLPQRLLPLSNATINSTCPHSPEMLSQMRFRGGGGGDKLVANGAAVNRRLPAGRERIRTHLDWLDNGSRRIVAM